MNKRPILSLVPALLLIATAALADRPVDETREMRPDGRVSLVAVTGKFEIIGTDDSELAVTGSLGEDVRDLRIDGNEDNWSIELRARDTQGRQPRTSELTIFVPRGAEVEARTISGDLDLSDLDGRTVYVHSISGRMALSGVQPRRLSVETISGSQRLDHGGREETRLKSISGNIEASGLAGRIRINSISGNMAFDADAVSEMDLETVSGTVHANVDTLDQARLDMNSHSGSLDIALPADTPVDLRARTFSGRIKSELGADFERVSGPGEKLEQRQGSGQVRVEARSFSGNITFSALD